MTGFGPESDWQSSFGNRNDNPLADLYFYHSAQLMRFVDGQALTEFAASDRATVAAHAKTCYDQVLAAAVVAGVQIEPQAHAADYKSHGKSFMHVDPVSYNRNLP